MQFDSDICIVGAGPAGLSIARVLGNSGIRVTVVESGGRDGALNAQELSAGKSVGYPYHKMDKAHFSGIGGSTQLWRGHNKFRPLDAMDFEERVGVPNSGWPFGLGQLLPYYEQAQDILPLGPFDYTAEFWERSDSTPRIPLPDNDVYTAIFQTTSGGDSGARAIADLATNPNYRIMTETTVTELITADDGKRIDSARLLHRDGTRSSLSAEMFVLAAGGFDNTRLLLASNKRWANGLGNANGLVGRYFMEHPAVTTAYWLPDDAAVFGRLGLYEQHTVRGTPIMGALTLAEDVKRHEGLLNAAVFLEVSDDLRSSDVYRSLAMFSPRGFKNVRWTLPMYAESLASILRHPVLAASTLVGVASTRFPPRRKVFDLRLVSEQAPNPDSRVSLGTKRDATGLPEIVLDWRFTDLDRWSIRRTQEILRDSLHKTGLGTLEHLYGDEEPPARIYGQRHQMGTTRMDPDPKRGVVDVNCKVHGIHNLFVTGSSVFPTVGHANPTLTIVALALRLADHIGGLFESRTGVRDTGSAPEKFRKS